MGSRWLPQTSPGLKTSKIPSSLTGARHWKGSGTEIVDLQTELDDGVKLIILLEQISKRKLAWEVSGFGQLGSSQGVLASACVCVYLREGVVRGFEFMFPDLLAAVVSWNARQTIGIAWFYTGLSTDTQILGIRV